MTVTSIKNDFVKLNSYGFQLDYKGTYIIYKDSTNTFLLFFYKKFCRCYVINGLQKEQHLVQVKEKITVIAKYNQKACKRFYKFLLKKVETDPFIFFIDPLFFKEITVFLERRHYMEYINYLFEKYRRSC